MNYKILLAIVWSGKVLFASDLTKDPDLSMHLSFEGENKIVQLGEGVQSKIVGSSEFTEGVQGKAIYLGNEQQSYLDLWPVKNCLNLSKGTMMFWFKPHWSATSNAEKHCLLWVKMKSKDQSEWLSFYQSFSEKNPTVLYFSLSWENVLQLNGGKWLKENQWIHLAMTWDSENNRSVAYINGEKSAFGEWKNATQSDSNQENARFNPERIYLGKYYPEDAPINAEYDELLILKRPLDAIELDQYYQSTKQ
jgi:hypothetical protein